MWKKAVGALVSLPVLVAGLALGAGTAVAQEQDTPAVAQAQTQQVQAQADATDVADGSNGYLWLNFKATDYEKVNYGYSADGYKWTALNDGNAIMSLNTGTKGIRDPHIIRLQQPDADGNKYVMIGTDLHAEGSAGGGSWGQINASKYLVVAKSKDLVTWTTPELVSTGLEGKVGNAWAPEAIWDDETNDYLVYWSSRDLSTGNTNGTTNLKVYKAHTTDFASFKDPTLWIDSSVLGKDTAGNIIDTTIVKGDDGDYYRFSTSDWNTVIDTSPTLEAAKWTRLVERASGINADGTSKITGDKVISSTDAGFTGSEGLTVYQLPDGKWMAMADNNSYRGFVIDKLSSLKTGGKFAAASGVSFSEKFRHGTVMALTAAEQKAVLAAYSDAAETVAPDADGAAPIATYDFDGDTAGKDGTGTNDLTLNGAAALTDADAASAQADATGAAAPSGKVLTLDGTTGTYAEFPKGMFDGRNKLTVQMDVKSESEANTNQFTFAFGKSNAKYYFMKYNKGTLANRITVGSYGAESKADATLDGAWHRVTVVLDDKTMTVYSDGEQVAQNKATSATVTDLGKNLAAYLGKSFYNDPYFKGSFDNIKVWNRALAAKEITGEDTPDQPATGKVASYDFEDEANLGNDTTGNGNTLTLSGVNEYGKPGDWGSKVIQLRGDGGYAQFPDGFFDGRDEFTLEFSSKSRQTSGNFFSFAIGQDQNKYLFLRLRGNEAYAAITTGSYQNEQKISGAINTQVWNKYTLTVTKNHIALYGGAADGSQNLLGQVDTTVSISDFGTGTKAYFGKSFYASDGTYNGGIDDVNVYDYAKSQLDILGPAAALKVADTDQVLSQNATADDATGAVTKTIVLDYWADAKTGAQSDKKNVSFKYEIPDGVTIADENGKALTAADLDKVTDYSQPLKLKATYDGKTVDYTVGVEVLNTPIRISGDQAAASGIGEKDPTGNEGWKFFADPQVVAYGGKYYIFPTTDGYSGWAGHSIHVFESSDMVNWEDKGTVVDLSKDYGDMIDGRKEKAWAPGFAIRNNKFYLYFSGGGMTNVAISDPKQGGTITSGYKIQKVKVEDSIDPAVFQDPNEPDKYYLAWGQSPGKYAELNEDMTGIVAGTTVTTNATKDMREGSYITSRPDPKVPGNTIYYYSYSCWDTNEPRYSVGYAYVSAKKLSDVKGTDWQYGGYILTKDDAKGILGTAHHSFVQVPNTDDWYIVYHAFLPDDMRPRGYDSTHNGAQLANGNKREVRIARVTYADDGKINVIPVTYEGVLPETTPAVSVSGAASGEGAKTAVGTKLTAAYNEGWKLASVQWYRADDASGANEAAIEGATSAEYTLTAADAGKTVYAKTVGENTTGVLQNAQPGTEGAAASKTSEMTSAAVAVAEVPVDTVAPVFAGVEDATVEFGASFDPLAGVSASDDVDGDVTKSIKVEGTVDTNKAGDYTLTYTVSDAAGNEAKATRKVTVKAKPAKPISKVTASVDKTTLTVGETAKASVKVEPADADDAGQVKWQSSNTAVATVAADGTVKAVAPGTAEVFAVVGTMSSNPVRVTVKAAAPAFRFTDVVSSTPHSSDIQWLADNGISTGWSTGADTAVFSPMGVVIRQDMAAFLYRLAGSPAFDETKAVNPFTDVTKDTPHYKEILWLASTGISKGFRQADGTYRFGPERAVVRQDMAAFLKRLADVKDAKPELGQGVTFTDVNDKTPHADDIAWLAQTGVTTGWANPDGRTAEFRGMNVVVRQDMAAFLHRMSTNVLK